MRDYGSSQFVSHYSFLVDFLALMVTNLITLVDCLISHAAPRDGHKVISAPQNACGNFLKYFFLKVKNACGNDLYLFF